MRRGPLLLLILLLAVAAVATTVIPMSVERLATQSTHVVYAHALEHHSAWNPDHTRIFTYTRFQVMQSLKGNAPPNIVVKQLGGHAGGYDMKVAGVRYWQNGEDAVLFLQPTTPGDGTYRVTGLMQGDFRVAQTAAGNVVVSNGVPEAKEVAASGDVQAYQGSQMTLQELEKRVRQAVGQ